MEHPSHPSGRTGRKPVNVVINNQYGGFRLSKNAVVMLRQNDVMVNEFGLFDEPSNETIRRDDPVLLWVVGRLGKAAGWAPVAALVIKTIPPHTRWEIREEDGWEWVVDLDEEAEEETGEEEVYYAQRQQYSDLGLVGGRGRIRCPRK